MMLLLIGTVSALVEEDTWLEEFLENLYSSLGQQAGCETYPDDWGTFNSPKTVYCTGGEFPGTNDCLINVFHANYEGTQPAFECGNFDVEGEVNNCLEYIVTTGSRTIHPLGSNSIYEVYNCPIGSLSNGGNQIGDCDCDYGATHSSCDSSDTCGVNKPKCMEQSGDDACVTTGQYANECSNGLDGSSTECECDSNYFDSTWKNQRCPSTRPYCVDNSIAGTSKDACSTNPAGPGLETCSNQGGEVCGSGKTCSIGFTDVSDTNYCCLGVCVSDNGVEDNHYMAKIVGDIKISKTKVSPKGIITITGKIKNNLDKSQKYLLEVGIIPSGVADDWYIPYQTVAEAKRGEVKWYDWAAILFRWPTLFATIEYTPETQCCENQENIEDYWVTLEPNEEYEFNFNVKAPHKDIEDKCGNTDYWVGEGDYVVYAYLTTGCTIEGPEYPGIYQGVATARIEVREGGGDLESQISLTKKEWEEAVDLKEWKLVTSSMCTLTSQCGKIEDYEVECKKSDDIWDANYKAIKENWGEFVSDISFLMGWGIFPEKLADIGVGVVAWLIEAEEHIPRGTCRASKPGDLCGFFEKARFFDITGDPCADGGIIMVGGLLLFIIIWSRMAGCYGSGFDLINGEIKNAI